MPKTIKFDLLGTIPISSESYHWRKKCNPEAGPYAEFLRDGKILAEVLAAACPTPLGQAKVLSENPSDRERIEKVVYDLFDFGVQPSNLFEPDDLLKKRNIPQVRGHVYILKYFNVSNCTIYFNFLNIECDNLIADLFLHSKIKIGLLHIP